MEKRIFNKPVIRKGKVQLSAIVCKRAACSGGSSHTATTYKSTQIVTLKKVS